MEINFLEEAKPVIYERLGRLYNQNSEYKKALDKETELFSQLEKCLSKEQEKILKKYQDAILNTFEICEMIAYNQGMKDFAGLLAIEVKEEKGE